jgi:hypothetical protein
VSFAGYCLGPPIEARLPDIETAGLLGTDLTQAVLAVRLVVTDAAGRPVEVSDTPGRHARVAPGQSVNPGPRADGQVRGA